MLHYFAEMCTKLVGAKNNSNTGASPEQFHSVVEIGDGHKLEK